MRSLVFLLTTAHTSAWSWPWTAESDGGGVRVEELQRLLVTQAQQLSTQATQLSALTMTVLELQAEVRKGCASYSSGTSAAGPQRRALDEVGGAHGSAGTTLRLAPAGDAPPVALTAHDLGSLGISTSGHTRILVTAAGNVGFGTDSPQSMLHVGSGNATVDQSLSIGGDVIVGGMAQTASMHSGSVAASSLTVTGAAQAGSLSLTSGGKITFPDGTEQTTKPAVIPPQVITHNLVSNSFMSELTTGTPPRPKGFRAQAYSCSGCSITIEAVHSYTRCFDGPYCSVGNNCPTSSTTDCAAAGASLPMIFGTYNTGPRTGRAGLTSGWGSSGDGKLLKITGTRGSSGNVYVNMPIEARHQTSRMLQRGYINIVSGGATWGTDQGVHIEWTSSTTAPYPQGWMPIHRAQGSSHMTHQNHAHAWILKCYGSGAGGSGPFEIYFALPYLANVWLPDADGTDGVYTHHWSMSVRDVIESYASGTVPLE